RTPKEVSKEVSEVQIDIPRAGHKYPLGLARFMASSHVVMGHLFARGVIEPLYFFGWGFTWVPWFFMLSGFVLFSAYLNKPKTDSMFGYVLRRSGTIYPLYAFAFLLGKVRGNIYTEWPTLLAQSFLMQAWVPYFTENALQMHCWFLSCMVVYWFFFPPMSKALKDIGLLQTWLLMIFFFFLPWLLILIPLYTHEEVDWYKEHDFYQTDSYLDLGVIMLKYHPICYFHVFILGMLLAKLRQLLDVHARSLPHGCFSWRNPYNLVLQFIAPLGYAGVFIVFSDQDLDAKAWGYKLSARVSVLLPFQAMILFGLAGLPSLPFPLFSYAFSMMDFLENYSYAVYVFQFLLYALWPQTGHVNLPLFLVFVYASAYIIGNCIQQPLQKWWAAHPNGQLAVPFLLAAFFMAGCFCPTFGESVPTMEDLPRVIRLNEAMVDMDLGLTDAGHVGPGEGAAIINPSVLLKDDEVIVLARRHRRETRQQNGWYEAPDGERTKAVIIEQVWHSTILMGSQKFRDQTLVTQMFDHWPRSNMSLLGNLSLDSWDGLSTKDGDAWRDLCVVERWIPSNKTLMRLVVTGPEDPKIVTTGTGYEIAFDSQPPKSVTTCRRNTKGMLDSVAQMYLASGVQNTERWRPTRAYRLSYGPYDVAEKNWIPFVYQGKTYFVYTPVPHVIVSAKEEGESKMLYSTTFHPLHQLRQKWPQVEIRGSAQAILVDAPNLTQNLPRPHYLALLHLFDTSTKRYAHHAYRFQHEPPFMILQVSSQLPLSEAAATPNGVAFAFASGLAVKGNTVLVTYGAGDREARALVMTMEKLDAFFHCG
ncbi:unnamed protein product, partial [Cladocopium goreaui]